MRSRRTATVSASALILSLSLAGGFGLGGRAKTAEAESGVKEGGEDRVARGNFSKTSEPVVVHLHSAMTLGASSKGPIALETEAAAVLAKVVELRSLAEGSGLELSDAQWLAFAEVAGRTQAVRAAYEAEIAQVTAKAPSRFHVEVPGYAEAGVELRRSFHAALADALGDAAAVEVVDRLSTRLEGYFGGFGVSMQTIEVVGDVREGANCEVVRTVSYRASHDESAPLVTRRETHLPAWDDPAGECWAPLFAKLSGTS